MTLERGLFHGDLNPFSDVFVLVNRKELVEGRKR